MKTNNHYTAVFVASWLASCSASQSAPTPVLSPVPSVFGSAVKMNEIHDLVRYPVRIISRVDAVVLSETDGVVRRMFVPLGAKVKRGQYLLEITNTDPVFQYQPFRVVSPVSGVLGSIDVSLGSRVTRGQKIAFVTDPTQIRAQMELVSSHAGKLKAGTLGTFFLGEPSAEQKASVRIKGVSPFLDPALGTATAELEFTDKVPPSWIRLGAVGQAEFEINKHTGFRIKEEAVRYAGDQPYVRWVQDGKVARAEVEVGKKDSGFVEIEKGLTEGMVVIERSSATLKDGAAVTVQQQ